MAALTTAPLISFAATADAAPPWETPVALTGSVPSGTDAVQISVVPPLDDLHEGQAASQLPLDDAIVTVDGATFTANVDPASIPTSYLQDKGLVDFEVYATDTDDDRAWRTTTSARVINVQPGSSARRTLDTPEQTWVDPVESAPAVAHATGRISARTAVAGSEVLPTLGEDELDEYELEDDGVPVGDVYTEVQPRQLATCQHYFMGVTRVRSTTIGTTYPVGNDTAKMRIKSSEGGSYGIAFNVAGDSAGFKADGTKFTQDSWGKDWDATGQQRSYRKGIEYHLNDIWCGATEMGTEWRPAGETGGTGHNNGITRPTWNTYCANVDKGSWFRDSTSGTAYSYGAAVKFKEIIGIDLSARRDYSSNQFIKYNLTANNKRLCGSDDYPARAGKIIQRFR